MMSTNTTFITKVGIRSKHMYPLIISFSVGMNGLETNACSNMTRMV